MEKKVTKRDMYADLYTVVENSDVNNKTDLLGFIDHEIELLDKKSSKKTLTATQKENLEIKAVIKSVMKDLGKPVRVSELNKDEKLTDYQPQKLSALLKQMVETGEVIKTTEKKVSYFSLV